MKREEKAFLYRETPISSASGSDALKGRRAMQKAATIGSSWNNHEASPMRGLGNNTSL